MVKKTDVFPCSFSDHCVVVAELDLVYGKECNEDIIGRNFSPKNIDKIIDKILTLSFCDINRFNTTSQQWGYLNNSIMGIIVKIAPVRNIKKRRCAFDPWWDSELNLVKRQRDFLYTIYTTFLLILSSFD